MVNVVVYWNTNIHTVDNGVHGSRLDYQCEVFSISFRLKVSKTGKTFIMFSNFIYCLPFPCSNLGIFLVSKVYFDLIKFALTISFLSILSWKFIKDRVIYPNYFYKIVLMWWTFLNHILQFEGRERFCYSLRSEAVNVNFLLEECIVLVSMWILGQTFLIHFPLSYPNFNLSKIIKYQACLRGIF